MNFEIKFVLINCLNNTFSIPYGENFLSNITQFWTFHYYLLSPRAKKQLLAITFAHVKSSPLHVDGSLDLTWGTVIVFAWFSEWFDHTGTYLFFTLRAVSPCQPRHFLILPTWDLNLYTDLILFPLCRLPYTRCGLLECTPT